MAIHKRKKAAGGTGRWIGVGALTAVALLPVVTAMALPWRRRSEIEETPVVVVPPDTFEEMVEGRTPRVKPSLSEQIGEHPYSRELVRRGEALSAELEDLIARGSTLTRNLYERSESTSQDALKRTEKVAKDLSKRGEDTRKGLFRRGEKVVKDLSERSEDVRQDLSKRGEQVAKDISERSEEVRKDLSKRTKKARKEFEKRSREASRTIEKRRREMQRELAKAQQELSERRGLVWIIVGFSVGLALTGIGAYFLVRRRLEQQKADDEMHYQLSSNNGHQRVAVGAGREVENTEGQSSVVETALTTSSILTDSPFVGVTSTKYYYPTSSTALEGLRTTQGSTLDIIYFASEEEARSRGYTRAE